MEKFLKILGNCIIILVIVSCLPLAIPRIMGMQEYNVITGSMTPEIPVGSIVYVKPVDFQELAEGDIIAFDVGASVVTHRIVELDAKHRLITTRGDANPTNDFMPVTYENVLGRVVAHYPFIGNIAALISETKGKIVAFLLLVVGVLLASVEDKKKKEINPKVILALGLVIVFGSIGGFVYIYLGYQKSNDLYDSLEKTYVTKTDDQVLQVPWQEMLDVDISALQSINPDVAGWIYVEGTDISYPIMHSGDDERYLRTTIDKEYATAGSIFLEGYNLKDFSDSHNIIYGHNMRNLSMFGKLKYYKTDENFYDEHRYFQIITPTAKMRFEIFSYFDTEPASWVYTVPYYDNPEFQGYIDDLNKHAYKEFSVAKNVTSADKIVTLSTCSAQEMRFTVHGYLVDKVD
ncbi:class B sortase [Pseudobutyrivibrio sp. UC1225]|uniref:class B sortase n=1 Tax=Pseudobutyrivibrio sp. UC1225 TaxID=1798185 RepID=UPI000B89E8BA|nr:class B sortase [Pseudobutyrivibrio sp. UC1225]